MKDRNMGTGYSTHTLYSNPDRVIIVPEKYAKKSQEMLEVSEGIENLSELASTMSKNKYFNEGGYTSFVLERLHIPKNEGGLIKSILKDRIYITTCINMANEDIRSKGGLEKENATHCKSFFEKIMESLGK